MALFDMDWAATMPVDFANMTPYEIGRNVLVPFILVFIILWNVLERIRIFNKKINVILSLGISILLATTPAFTFMAAYITQVSGGSMLLIFGILLVGGTLVWALGRGRDVYYEQIDSSKILKRLYKKRAKYHRKAREARDRGDQEEYRANMRMAREVEDDIAAERTR